MFLGKSLDLLDTFCCNLQQKVKWNGESNWQSVHGQCVGRGQLDDLVFEEEKPDISLWDVQAAYVSL